MAVTLAVLCAARGRSRRLRLEALEQRQKLLGIYSFGATHLTRMSRDQNSSLGLVVMLWTAPATGIAMCQSAIAVEERLESAYG